MPKLLGAAVLWCVLLCCVGAAQGAIQVAGQMLIDLSDSRGITTSGGTVTAWTNYGTAGGAFESAGADPAIGTVAGKTTVVFNGGQRLKTPYNSPSEIVGQTAGVGNPYSVEAWICTTVDVGEQCIFNWGGRAAPGGCQATAQLNMGNSGSGASTHWCWDIGWNGQPTIGNWHHVVLTYDGNTEIAYADGVQKNSQTSSTLNIDANSPCVVGAAWNSGWGAWELGFVGGISAVRVHSQTLSGANVLSNYNAGINAVVDWPARVQVAQATGIGTDSATLHGTLVEASAPTEITFFYGTSDAGENVAGWTGSASLGTTAVGPFSAPVTGLNSSTTYFCRAYGSNVNGVIWSRATTFRTLGRPVVENLAPTTLTPAYARLRGRLVSGNGLPTSVKVYWGTDDGGTASGAWANEVDFGVQGVGELITKVSPLTPGTTYYYRFYAENSAGGAWAPSSASFTTPTVFNAAGFNYKAEFGFAGYTQTETLLNFPVMLSFNAAIPGFDYGTFLSPNAADLRVVEANGGELDYEIDTWDPSGSSYIWVKVPELTNTTVITAYWGKEGQTAPAYTTNGATWNDGFAAVWHMNEKWVKDASQNGYNATFIQSEGAVSSTPGQIGTAQNYNAGVGSGGTAVGNVKLTNMTLSAWVWLAEANREGIFEAKGGDIYFWQQGDHLRFETSPWGGDTFVRGFPVGSWIHVAATAEPDPGNPANSLQKFYLNGVPYGSSWSKALPNPGDGDFWLAAEGGGRVMNGKLDECRAERLPRSAAWIWACWKNQGAPAQFMTNSPATFLGVPELALISPTVTDIGTAGATLGARIAMDGGSPALSFGTVWDTTPAPTANALATDGPVSAPYVFTQVRTGMSPGTHYYFRGWASNAANGLKYSSERDFYTEPTSASGVAFSGLNNTILTISWANPPEAAGSVAVIRLGQAVSALPADGTVYTGNSAFGVGSAVADGQYVVYAGAGTSVAVTGLFPGATYHVAVFTYAGSGSLINYQQLNPAAGNQTTANRSGPVAVAGDLLIDLNLFRGVQTNGTGEVSGWTNHGTLGGNFMPSVGYPAPVADTASGLPCVAFGGSAGSDYRRLVLASSGGTPIPAPNVIGGNTATYSVEFWVHRRPAGLWTWEEHVLAFGNGGDCGNANACAFGYGNSSSMIHWCYDMGWGGGAPTPGTWHHIVITRQSGGPETLYVDGLQRDQITGTRNFRQGDPIVIGGMLVGDGLNWRGANWFNGQLNGLRLHSDALTAAQVADNYQLGPRFAIPSEDVTVNVATDPLTGDATITFNTVVGLKYKVEYTDVLPARPEDWFEVFPGVQEAVSTTTSVVDIGALAATPQRFYRVAQVP